MKWRGLVVLIAVAAAGCAPKGSREAEARGAVAEYTAPVTLVPGEFAEVTESWRWCIPATVRPLLVTALGDVFVETETGEVQFLDTEAGKLDPVAPSRERWLALLKNPDAVEHWFRPAFVRELKTRGKPLAPGQVYSPTVPLSLSGQLTVQNYTPRRWEGHLHVLGQLHRQTKDLPPGTKITKIEAEPW